MYLMSKWRKFNLVKVNSAMHILPSEWVNAEWKWRIISSLESRDILHKKIDFSDNLFSENDNLFCACYM